jgi:pimeloyl-ACP methyl ester carboxylesterase
VPRPVPGGTATTRLTCADGTALALHDLGGHGQPTLFAHAAGFHGRIWGPVAARLADDLRSWGLDLRGHGESGPTQAPVDWANFGNDVNTAAHGIGGPLLGVGHSLGGAALLMAEMAMPGTFSHLVLYEPAVADPSLMDTGAPSFFASVARRRRAWFPSHADAYKNFALKPPTNVFGADVLNSYTTYGFAPDGGGVRILCLPETEAAIYESTGPRDVWERLGPIGCPVTLVHGANSEIWDQGSSARVATRLGTADIHVLRDAGHFGPLERPDAFSELLRELRSPTSFPLPYPDRLDGPPT